MAPTSTTITVQTRQHRLENPQDSLKITLCQRCRCLLRRLAPLQLTSRLRHSYYCLTPPAATSDRAHRQQIYLCSLTICTVDIQNLSTLARDPPRPKRDITAAHRRLLTMEWLLATGSRSSRSASLHPFSVQHLITAVRSSDPLQQMVPSAQSLLFFNVVLHNCM